MCGWCIIFTMTCSKFVITLALACGSAVYFLILASIALADDFSTALPVLASIPGTFVGILLYSVFAPETKTEEAPPEDF